MSPRLGSHQARKALIIFLKFPEEGLVKTRLSREIGHEAALHLYQKLVRRTLGVAVDFKGGDRDTDVFVFYAPPDRKIPTIDAYPGPWEFAPQVNGHLGEKMAAAFVQVFGKGYRQVVLIGTDIADITVTDLRDAFRALRKKKAVLGPALDGGFYLIGLCTVFDEVFNFRSWSNPGVFQRTLKCFHSEGLEAVMIKQRRDIDHKRDLDCLREDTMFQDQISIIIPFLNKTKTLAWLINFLEVQLWPGDEILLVRGVFSSDRKPEKISSCTSLLYAPIGRGTQLNLGARMAQNNLLWFLHADTCPPPNFGYHIRKISQSRQAVLGCFELQFSPTNIYLDMISKWANLRTKYLKLPYGDQGFFCARRVFEESGGFRKRFLMEDVDFARNSRKLGKLLVMPDKMLSSSQRYLHEGILRASLLNHLIVFLYFLGVNDKKLYARYYGC